MVLKKKRGAHHGESKEGSLSQPELSDRAERGGGTRSREGKGSPKKKRVSGKGEKRKNRKIPLGLAETS